MIPIIKGPEPQSLKKAQAETKQNLAIYKQHLGNTQVKSSAKGKGKSKVAGSIYITAAYREDDVKVALIDSHYGKCAYCETYILHTSHGDVEHFRPKSKYTDDSGGGQQLGYFWLAYDWNNLFLACPICNETFKHTYFSLMPEVEGLVDDTSRMEPGTAVDASKEYAVLIDPERENPRALLEFDPVSTEVRAVQSLQGADPLRFKVDASRAGKNVIHLGLNRDDLVAARHRHRAFLRGMFALVAQAVHVDGLLGQNLVKVRDQLVLLKKAYDVKQARQLHQQINEQCAKLYSEGPDLSKPPTVANGREALKWLLFCVTSQAEYSALSQDLLIAWTEELINAVQQRNSVPSSTAPNPSQQQQGTATNTVDTSLAVLWVPPVSEHVQRLAAARKAYARRREKLAEDVQESLRQQAANEVNELAQEFNAFQDKKSFVPGEAYDHYSAWATELEELNDEFELLGTTKAQAERGSLLKVLEDELAAHEKLQRYPLDQRLKQLSQAYQSGVAAKEAGLNECWKLIQPVLDRATFILKELEKAVAQSTPKQLSPNSMDTAADNFPMPQDLVDLARYAKAVVDVRPKTLNEKFQKFLQQYQAVLGAYTQLSLERRRTACDLPSHQTLQSLLQQLKPDLTRLGQLPPLPDFLKLVKDALSECDALLAEYQGISVSRTTWRGQALDAMRNDLLDTDERIIQQHDPLLLADQRAPLPQPTVNDPYQDMQVAHAFKPLKPVKLRIKTALSEMEDYEEKLANGKRKPTRPQLAKLEELIEAESQVREHIINWELEAERRLVLRV